MLISFVFEYIVINPVHVHSTNDSLRALVKLVNIYFKTFSNKFFSLENNQCAPGRVLCQNLIHCAESARICEQDYTQYNESFKSTARCTIDQPNDGFNCYYSIHGSNNTCIPFQWLCDGDYDCPFGNDEEHCHKLTTTIKPAIPISRKCLTEHKCK
jgi:hypothetical protein